MGMRSIGGAALVGALVVACGGIAQTGSGERPLDQDGGVAGGGAGGWHGQPASGGAPSGGAPSGGGGAGGLPWGCTGCPMGGGGSAGAPWVGAGGAPTCVATNDAALIAASGFAAPDGGSLTVMDITVDGRVASVTADTFVIDQCTLDCGFGPSLTKFTVSSPGLDLSTALTAGAFARVHYVQSCPWGCTYHIVVQSLPSWGGATNRYPAESGVYLVADDGGMTSGDLPFQVEHLPEVGCPSFPGGGCAAEAPGTYFLRFASSSSGQSVDVPMGQTQSMLVGGGMMQVRNLRSYISGACDDYWNWAYWAVNQHLTPL